MIPNFKLAKQISSSKEDKTVVCTACKKPLWTAHVVPKTSPMKIKMIPCEGVSEYQDLKGLPIDSHETKCPFCKRPWFKVTEAHGHIFPVPEVLEWT